MRFYTGRHRFHCGIELHAHTMAVCVLDATGEIVLERNLATTPEAFLGAIAPYREGLVVACECLFTWSAEQMLSARREPRYVLGAASLCRNRSEVGPRGGTISEDRRPPAASGEDYLLTTSGAIPVGRRPRRSGYEMTEAG